MESNDQEEIVDDIVETKDEDENDTTDWKALALKNQGIAKRLHTKIEKAKVEAKVEKKVEKEREKVLTEKGLDRLDKAILRAMGITKPEEIELVEAMMKESGKDIEGVLASKFFQSELTALREAQATKDATPSGTKRSGQSPRDEVDYWIAKGEMPPQDQLELRMKVVAKKREVMQSKNQFSDEPVVK